MTRIKHIHRNRTFSLLLTKVSLEALEELTQEMMRVQALRQNEESCGCILRSSCGLPCACELSKYVYAGQSVPLQSINVFWKKLNFEPALSNNDEEETPTVDLNQHFQMFEQAYKKEDNSTVKKSWLQKMRGIWDPNSTSYDEPAVQTKTRGRPSTNSKQQSKPDLPPAHPPLQRTYSSRPPRHSSYASSGERVFAQQPRRHSSVRYTQYEDTPTPSDWDYDYIHGYHSTFVNNETTFDPPVDPPTQPSPEQSYHDNYYNPSPSYNADTYWNPFINQDNFWNPFKNQNTFGFTQPAEPSRFQNVDDAAEQTNFTNTSGPTEYDFMGLNQHNVDDRKSDDYHNYIDQIPTVFHPYVKDIKNVLGDGNCGFRATASALGYGEDDWLQIRRMLIDEIEEFKEEYKKAFTNRDYNDVFTSLHWSGTGIAPQKYWMIMPYTGFLIANKFNVIVHYISKEHDNSSTIFPLWRGPDEFQDKNIISVALVSSNHFLMVEMERKFPMASTNTIWNIRKWPAAEKWESVFRSRQNKYKASFQKKIVHHGTID